jgi:predicted nucleic acid-binding protein
MIAVSNTSPLIALSKIGYVVYLRELFERVCIPKGVVLETSKKDDDVWDATEKQIKQGFVVVKTVKNVSLVRILNQELGIGESEAIALSVEIKPDFVLLDDLEAREYARSFGLNVTGTLGIIRALLRRGIVKETPKEIYEKLKSIDFWISEELFSRVCL